MIKKYIILISIESALCLGTIQLYGTPFSPFSAMPTGVPATSTIITPIIDTATVDKDSIDKAMADKAAIDKTATEKASADKAAIDKAAANKASADKAAIDKALIEKIAVYRAVSAKSPADKAAADKAAADKATADKAAADKATADKAAANKATADAIAAIVAQMQSPLSAAKNLVTQAQDLKYFPEEKLTAIKADLSLINDVTTATYKTIADAQTALDSLNSTLFHMQDNCSKGAEDASKEAYLNSQN